MARTKDNAFVMVIGGLTQAQAGQMIKEITRSKMRRAPDGRLTMARGSERYIERSNRTYLEGR